MTSAEVVINCPDYMEKIMEVFLPWHNSNHALDLESINLQDRFFMIFPFQPVFGKKNKLSGFSSIPNACQPYLHLTGQRKTKKKTIVPKLSDFHQVSDFPSRWFKSWFKRLPFVPSSMTSVVLNSSFTPGFIHVDGRNPKQPPVIYETL